MSAAPSPAPTVAQASAASAVRPVFFPLFGLLAAATVFAVARDGSWGAALAGALGPDLALALGVGSNLVRGQLHPRAVPLYNAVHRFLGPVALVTVAALGALGTGWLIAGLAWATHVALDRSVGYGLRTRDGFQRVPPRGI
jgi:hypothetical protein